MSVNETHYVILGNKYDYDDFYSRVAKKNGWNEPLTREKFLEDWRETVEALYADGYWDPIKNHNGVSIVVDGMGGKYVWIGNVIAKSDRESGQLVQIPPAHNIWDDTGDDIVRAVGFAEEIEILAFTHYS